MNIKIEYEYFEEFELKTTDARKSLLNIIIEIYKLARKLYPTKEEDWDEKRALSMEFILKEIIKNHGLTIGIKSSCKKKLKEKGEISFINFHLGVYSYFIVNLMAPDEYFKENFPYQSIRENNVLGSTNYKVNREKSIKFPENLKIFVKTTTETGEPLDDFEVFLTYLHEFTHFLNTLEKFYYETKVDELFLNKIIKKSFKKGLVKWFDVKYIE
jgi:hypothetical protein